MAISTVSKRLSLHIDRTDGMEAKDKVRDRFQDRPDQVLGRRHTTSEIPLQKKSKGIRAVCGSLLGSLRKNPDRAKNQPPPPRDVSNKHMENERRRSSTTDLQKDSHRPPSPSFSSSNSTNQMQPRPSSHTGMPSNTPRTTFVSSAVLINSVTTQQQGTQEEEEEKRQEEIYLMALMEGDASDLPRRERNGTVITVREEKAIAEGRERHQKKSFTVTHHDYPDEGTYGRGYHEDIDITYVAPDHELKDYVWGTGGVRDMYESSEDEKGSEEEHDQDRKQHDQGEAKTREVSGFGGDDGDEKKLNRGRRRTGEESGASSDALPDMRDMKVEGN